MNTLKIFIFRSATVRALSSAIVAILLVCVISRVSSTRYATHEPRGNGALPQASPLPFDLVPQGEDANGLSLNPQWGEQVNNPGKFPNPQYTDENPICPDKDFRGPLCSSPGQVSGIDGPEANYAICFWGPSGPHRVKGHVNWTTATYTGSICWEGRSLDGDYDLNLRPDGDAGLTLENAPRIKGGPRNPKYIHVEFDSEETADAFKSPLWTKFRKYLDPMCSGANYTCNEKEGRKMIDGRRAIVTGLMGLDSEHGGYSELHPVYAMAIQTQPSQPGEDTWMIFARNWGGEGFCSGSIFHTLPSAMKEFTIELPIPSATAAVTGADITTDFYSYDTDDCPQVAFVQGKGVVITFNTPMESFPTKPIQRPLIEGEVHVHWLTTGMIQTSPPVSCDPRLQQEFRQDQKDFAKALLGRRLAEKEKTRFFSLETEAVRDYFNPSNLLHCGVSGPGEVGTSILPTPGVSGLTAENSSLGMQRSQYPAARRRLMLRSLHQATIKTRRVGRRR